MPDPHIPDDHPSVKYMTSEQRHASGVRYAGSGTTYPIRPEHPEDVRHAWDLAGHADDPAEVRRNVIRIAHDLHLEHGLPETAHADSEMNTDRARKTLADFDAIDADSDPDLDPAAESPGPIAKFYDAAEFNFTPGERSLVAWITADCIDREGDVVIAEGVDFRSEYLDTNPVVMAIHDYRQWPIGTCDQKSGGWIKLRKGKGFTGLVSKMFFDTDDVSEFVYGKCKRGIVRSVSIGFRPPDDMRPGEWGPPTREELRVRPDWAGAKRIIRRCIMIEYSIVPIGMNPRALVVAVNKSARPLAAYQRAAFAAAITMSEIKGAIPHEKMPVSHAPHDPDGAEMRVRKYASHDGSGDKATIDFDKYEKAFGYVDHKMGHQFGAYKLLHHDVNEKGDLVTSRLGVQACGKAMMGDGHGVPGSQVEGVKSHLSKHYAEFKGVPPWEREEKPGEPADEPTKDVDDDMTEEGVKDLADGDAPDAADRAAEGKPGKGKPGKPDAADAIDTDADEDADEDKDKFKDKKKSAYGFCPQCGAPGVMRERRHDGNDRCEKGHEYPSRSAQLKPKSATPPPLPRGTRTLQQVEESLMVATLRGLDLDTIGATAARDAADRAAGRV